MGDLGLPGWRDDLNMDDDYSNRDSWCASNLEHNI